MIHTVKGFGKVNIAEIDVFLEFSCFFFFFFPFIFISWRLITLQYCNGFCHTLTWISHGFTCVPHPDVPSRLPLHPIPLGLPSAPAQSTCLMPPFQRSSRCWQFEVPFKDSCVGAKFKSGVLVMVNFMPHCLGHVVPSHLFKYYSKCICKGTYG